MGVLPTETVSPIGTVSDPMTTPGKTVELPENVVVRDTGFITTLVEPTATGATCGPVGDLFPELGCVDAVEWPTTEGVCEASCDEIEGVPVEKTVIVV